MWRGIVNRAFTADNVGSYLQTLNPPSFVKFIVVHNTGAPSLKTYRGYANRPKPITDTQWLKNLEGYYRDQQGWQAGPHWFVTPNVKGLLAFTPSTVPGTHTPSWNSKSLGIETVGDFQVEPFNADTKHNLVALLAALHSWLGLDPSTIRFHKEDARTTHKDCPGKNLVKGPLIAAVRAKMAESDSIEPVAAFDVPRDNEGHSVADENDDVEVAGIEATEIPLGVLKPPVTPVPPSEVVPVQERIQQATEAVATGAGVVYTVKSAFRSKIAWLTGGLGGASATTAVASDPETKGLFLTLVVQPAFWLALVCVVLAGYVIYLRWRDYGRGNPNNIIKAG